MQYETYAQGTSEVPRGEQRTEAPLKRERSEEEDDEDVERRDEDKRFKVDGDEE